MKNLIILLLMMSFSFQALAQENARQVLNQINSVFEPKQTGISLEQAKEMAVGENIDVAIAYENLFRAQRKIGQARASYFPYGIGDALIIYYTNAFSALILVELATSLPTKWYFVKKQKHLRNAQAYNLKALKENIKNQVAHMYYTIVKEESLLKLTAYELKLMEELLTSKEAQVALGQASEQELRNIEYRALELRDEYLKFKDYLAEEKSAFKILLNRPYTASIQLQPVSDFLDQDDFNIEAQKLALMAQQRSYEVKAAQEMINAAYDSKVSARWSILSFGGIGFGYLSKVRVEGSKVNEAIIRKENVKQMVYQNVLTRKKMLFNSIAFYQSEQNIAQTTKSYMLESLERFNTGNIALSELVESQLYFLRDYREMIMAHYNTLIRLDDLERTVLGNTMDNQINPDIVNVKNNRRWRKTSFWLEGDFNMYNIKSVTYSVKGETSIDIKTFKARNNYMVKINNQMLSQAEELCLKIIFDNGEILNKTIKL